MLWPDKTTFQLHLTQAIALDPGQEAQALHRDQWCFDFFEFPAEVEVEVSTIWALTDFTEANGATRVAVGANHLPDSEVGTLGPADTVAAEMPRGSVVIYTGRTVHGGGANNSGSHPDRGQRRLRARVVAPGGEPVPRRCPGRWPPSCPRRCSG